MSTGENDFSYPPPVPRDERANTGDLPNFNPQSSRDDFNDPFDRPPYDAPAFERPPDSSYPQTGPYRRPGQSGLQPTTGHIRPGHRVRPRTSTRAISPRNTGIGTVPPIRQPQKRNGLIAGLVGGGLCLLVLAGFFGWLLNRDDSGEVETTGQTTEAVASATAADNAANTDPASTTVPLSPATLPDINEPGLVLYQLNLLDAYTGTGSTGSVELYMNALNGQICHVFDVAALTGQYVGFINQAVFPREGPSVINLGAAQDTMSQCTSASPIEVARAMTNPAEFYVAATDLSGEILLRGQLDGAIVAVDNRDDATVANQVALSAGAGNADAATALFDNENDGAYIQIDGRTVSFRGAVPDQAAADSLLAAFTQLTGRGVDVVNELQVEAGAPDPSGRVVIGDSLLFAINSDEITGDPSVLQTLADLLRVNPTWTATVTGHTDNVGLRAYNIDLSLRRANTVRSRLAALEIPESRIGVEGFGPDRPLGDNSTPEGRALNRRIEVTINS